MPGRPGARRVIDGVARRLCVTVVVRLPALDLGELALLLRTLALAGGLVRLVAFGPEVRAPVVRLRRAFVSALRAFVGCGHSIPGGRLAVLHRRHPVHRRRPAVIVVVVGFIASGETVADTRSDIAGRRRAIAVSSVGSRWSSRRSCPRAGTSGSSMAGF
jgi:hypothetical protein